MAEPTIEERLQPSLLDRLTDDDTQSTAEPSSARTLNANELRNAVIRDLQWLLNTTSYSTDSSLEGYDEVKTSTVNYGVPDLSGHVVSSFDPVELAGLVRQAILDFEPRIDRNTLHVSSEVSLDEMGNNALQFVIDAEVYAQPGLQHLMLKTTVDLDSGDAQVVETRA